jgi:hypothetical protein
MLDRNAINAKLSLIALLFREWFSETAKQETTFASEPEIKQGLG